MFCLNFVLGRLLPFVSISRQLESEQNVRFYLNLAQYIKYISVTLQNERRIFHFGRCRMYHSGLIFNRFSKLRNMIRIFNSALCTCANNHVLAVFPHTHPHPHSHSHIHITVITITIITNNNPIPYFIQT